MTDLIELFGVHAGLYVWFDHLEDARGQLASDAHFVDLALVKQANAHVITAQSGFNQDVNSKKARKAISSLAQQLLIILPLNWRCDPPKIIRATYDRVAGGRL